MDWLSFSLYGKRLGAPTDLEQEHIEKLRHKFRTVIPDRLSQPSAAAQTWADNIHQLAGCVRERDPRAFLRWNVVRETMFLDFSRTAWRKLRALRKCPDWRQRWSKVIIESRCGCPQPFLLYPKSSGNLVHHAYHLVQFEERTGMPVHEVDVVVEFGGGYGSMCRLFHNLGFRGQYVIFDLPAFSALQEYYLSSLGLGANGEGDSGARIHCVCDVEELRKVIDRLLGSRDATAMFLATWSLSETPLHVREAVVPLLSGFKAFLIAYQARFGEVDNVEYFAFFRNHFPRIEWRHWEIPGMPGNLYLMGNRTRG